MTDLRQSILGFVEAASKTLAPTKVEMEAVLATEERLSSAENANPEYLTEIRHARALLDASPDMNAFLSALHDHASGAVTSPAEILGEIHSPARSPLLAGLVFLAALLASAIVGYLHIHIWAPVLAGFLAYGARDASMGFQISRTGWGVWFRSVLVNVLIMLVVWGLGFGISQIMGGR